MFKRILVAIDGSSPSHRGFKAALDLAQALDARLMVLHVIDERAVGLGLSASTYLAPSYVEDVVSALRDSGRKVLAKAQRDAQARHQAVEAHLVESLGNGVADTILAQAKKLKPDVIVLGTHGRRGLARMVVGSDAETVLREANVPVLMVRAR